MAVQIRELRGDKCRIKDFRDVVSDIYRCDPHDVRPLDMEIADKLDMKKNPFFEHAEGTASVAYQDGRAVGRITAPIDREHIRHHADGAWCLYVEMNQAGNPLGITDGELSWAVEVDAPTKVGIKLMGGRVYKTYRVFERASS